MRIDTECTQDTRDTAPLLEQVHIFRIEQLTVIVRPERKRSWIHLPLAFSFRCNLCILRFDTSCSRLRLDGSLHPAKETCLLLRFLCILVSLLVGSSSVGLIIAAAATADATDRVDGGRLHGACRRLFRDGTHRCEGHLGVAYVVL